VIAALALCASLGVAPEPGAPPGPLAAVAFLEGHWVGGEGTDRSEEIWTPPAGRSMVGLWRYVIGGQARVVELLSLTAEEGGVVLRLRHFDAKLVARETRDKPVALKLVRSGPGEARFEGPAVGEPGDVVLSYRQAGPDGLSVTLEKRGKPQTFEFRRAPR